MRSSVVVRPSPYCDDLAPMEPTGVFVYGTLLPTESRWPLLEPYAIGARSATVAGRLFDTGRGYPCALFSGTGTIPGAVVTLEAAQVEEVLVLLDEVEGVAFGLYERVVVSTDDGERVWSYAWLGDMDELTPIVRWTDLT
jgi:gamma-glutamylcyclotransferase (GGCT)/AIG2-like uncharacterized protein YtfP